MNAPDQTSLYLGIDGIGIARRANAVMTCLSLARPFHRQMSHIADAIIIDMYIDALGQQDGDNVLAFVTHSIYDFSQKGADTRLRHPDLAAHFWDSFALFDKSRYALKRISFREAMIC